LNWLSWAAIKLSRQAGLELSENQSTVNLATALPTLLPRCEYLTAANNRHTGTISRILVDREKATLEESMKSNHPIHLAIGNVSMNWWLPFINAVR
jgi:hypothetical protein